MIWGEHCSSNGGDTRNRCSKLASMINQLETVEPMWKAPSRPLATTIDVSLLRNKICKRPAKERPIYRTAERPSASDWLALRPISTPVLA